MESGAAMDVRNLLSVDRMQLFLVRTERSPMNTIPTAGFERIHKLSVVRFVVAGTMVEVVGTVVESVWGL